MSLWELAVLRVSCGTAWSITALLGFRQPSKSPFRNAILVTEKYHRKTAQERQLSSNTDGEMMSDSSV